MYLGIVTGTITAERKASGLEGKKILLVQPVDENSKPLGDVQAAIDTVQAGVGDLVYLVGSREAALACDPWFV
jgi:ethanolamine utilization protein EutN